MYNVSITYGRFTEDHLRGGRGGGEGSETKFSSVLSHVEVKSRLLYPLSLGAAQGGGARGGVTGGTQVWRVTRETREVVALVHQEQVEDHVEILCSVIWWLRLVYGNDVDGVILLCSVVVVVVVM